LPVANLWVNLIISPFLSQRSLVVFLSVSAAAIIFAYSFDKANSAALSSWWACIASGEQHSKQHFEEKLAAALELDG
jgi:hypothetical protein